ncbi:MAG: hypothetical protein M1814_006462 [Vezdaea aestivalis]|nr:MAG: hypothetical protein M1814_006462 [Vezdaea aestivalis]
MAGSISTVLKSAPTDKVVGTIPLKPLGQQQVVRKVQMKDYKAAAATLADAFRHDKATRYIIDTPDMDVCSEEHRFKLHTEVFEHLVASFILAGLATTIGEDFGSVALWLPPGADNGGWCTYFRSGLWRLKYKLTAEGSLRWDKEFNPLLLNTKKEVLGERDEESYYLVYLATKSEAQGQGFGRKLIEDVTNVADEEGRYYYLESSHNENLPFYSRCGFETVKTVSLVRDAKPIDLTVMIREANNCRVLGSGFKENEK